MFGYNCLTLEDGTDRLPRNVRTKLPFYPMSNPKKKGRSHLHGGGSLKSCT